METDNKPLEFYIVQIVDMSDEDLALVMSGTQKRELKKGDVLLKEGEVGRSFYFVEKGYLRTYYNKEGVAINLNFAFEGDFTANLKSYRSRKPSELTIEAGEDTVVWVLNFDKISNKYNEHPQISRFVRRLAIDLLLASETHSEMFKIHTPTERYRYVEQHNPRLLQRISLSQMASYLGVTRETLSRIRGKNN